MVPPSLFRQQGMENFWVENWGRCFVLPSWGNLCRQYFSADYSIYSLQPRRGGISLDRVDKKEIQSFFLLGLFTGGNKNVVVQLHPLLRHSPVFLG